MPTRSPAQKDGSRYEGEFVNGVAQGAGKEVEADGFVVFEGAFRNGTPEGLGARTFRDGRRHEVRSAAVTMATDAPRQGVYANGERQGPGKDWQNGRLVYDGACRHCQRGLIPQAAFRAVCAAAAGGTCARTARTSRATSKTAAPTDRVKCSWSMADRSRCVGGGRGGCSRALLWLQGEFKDDMANGPGTLFRADGSRLEGTFKDDRISGLVSPPRSARTRAHAAAMQARVGSTAPMGSCCTRANSHPASGRATAFSTCPTADGTRANSVTAADTGSGASLEPAASFATRASTQRTSGMGLARGCTMTGQCSRGVLLTACAKARFALVLPSIADNPADAC